MQSDSERHLIGMIFRETATLDKVLATGVTPIEFQDEVCRELFAAIILRESENNSHDMIAMSMKFPQFVIDIATMAENAPITTSPDFFAKEIKAAAWARRASAELALLRQVIASRETHTEPTAIRERAASALQRISEGPQMATSGKTASVAIETLCVQIEESIEAQRDGREIGFSTGFSKIDQVIHRLRPGWLYVVGARPGVGKSAVCCQMALAAAGGGACVAYFTREMPAEDLAARLVQAHGRLDGNKMLEGTLDDDGLDRMMRSMRELSKKNIVIDDSYRGRIEALETNCRTLKRQNNLDIVFVDYLQQLRLDDKGRMNRNDELNDIVMRLKDMAMTLKIPVVAAAQLNRSGDGAPRISALKDCGGIEQEADVIILLHKEDEDTTLAMVEKNRRGKTGAIRLTPELQFSRFIER